LMSVEMSIIKERLGQILPGWNITEELEAVSKLSCFSIDAQQMNQIMSLGLFVSVIYHQRDTTVVEFSEMNNDGGYK